MSHLHSRICDFAEKSQKGELSISVFLTPAQREYAKIFLSELKISHLGVFIGGYSECERSILFVLPEYAESLDGSADEAVRSYFADEISEAIHALKIDGSKFTRLTHRDYLGSILALGVERDTIGDIVLLDDFSAVVFCTGKIAEFIKSTQIKIANDTVTVKDFDPSEDFCPQREFQSIGGTVASARLDCFVSALTNLSREKSQEIIKKELCQLNYITVTDCDFQLSAPCTLSIRGYGKFTVSSIDGVTKKGRMRFSARKYI